MDNTVADKSVGRRSHLKVLSELAQQRDRGESRNYPSRHNRRAQEGHFRQAVEFQQHLQKSEATQIHWMGRPECCGSLRQKVSGAS